MLLARVRVPEPGLLQLSVELLRKTQVLRPYPGRSRITSGRGFLNEGEIGAKPFTFLRIKTNHEKFFSFNGRFRRSGRTEPGLLPVEELIATQFYIFRKQIFAAAAMPPPLFPVY